MKTMNGHRKINKKRGEDRMREMTKERRKGWIGKVGLVLVLAVAMLICQGLYAENEAQAATCTSTGTGNWNTAGTWSCGSVPGAGDDVTIANGHVVTINAAPTNDTINSLTIAGGGNTTTLTFSGPYTLTVTNNVVLNASTAAVTRSIAVGTGTLNAANLTINGGNTSNWASSVTVSTGTVTLTGNLTFGSGTQSNGQNFIFSDAGTLNIGGNLNMGTSRTFTQSTSTVNYTGTGAQNVGGVTYYRLFFTGGSGTKTHTTANMTVQQNFTIPSGVTFAVGAFNLTVNGTTTIDSGGTLTFSSATGTKQFQQLVTVNGTWNNAINSNVQFRGGLVNNATAFTQGTGTYQFDTNNQAISGNATTLATVTVNNITLTNNITAGGLTVSTSLAGSGTLAQGTNAILNIGGTSTITTLDASAAGNTVGYTGAAQTIKAASYNNLTLSGSGNKTAGGAISVKGDWTVGGTSAFVPGTNTVTFSGTGAQAINGSSSFYNLIVSASNARTVTFQAGQTQTVSNSLVLAGQPGQLLTLASSTPSTQWNLVAPAGQIVQYVTPSDSNNTGTIINAVASSDGGNNTGWNFDTSAMVTVTSVSPNSGAKGSLDLLLAINGTNFASGANVTFSCPGLSITNTSFASSNLINATIDISSFAVAQPCNVTVTNPDSSSGTGYALFTINAPPVVSYATPNSGTPGATGQNIVITGAFFKNGATTAFSGDGITVNNTSFGTETQLTVNVDIAADAAPGSRNIIVINPDGGQGTGVGLFTVQPNNQTITGAITFPDISDTSIRVNVSFGGDADGDNGCTVVYGPTTSYGSTLAVTKSGANYTGTLTGLSAGQKVYFQAAFTDPDGISNIDTLTGSATTRQETSAAMLLHNANRFGLCDGFPAANGTSQATCQANGGTWVPTNKWSGSWGTTGGQYGEINCIACHTPRSSNIKGVTESVTGGFPGSSVVFKSLTHPDGFGDDTSAHATSTKICEVCHTQTATHKYNNAEADHFNRQTCTVCHEHGQGFSLQGDCVYCHASPQSIENGPLAGTGSRRAVAAEFSNTWSHKRSAGGTVNKYDCIVCHMEGDMSSARLTSKHGDGYIDLRDPDTGLTIQGVTFGGADAGRYISTGSPLRFARFSRNLGSATLEPEVQAVMINQCLKCHDADGAKSPSAQVPGGSALKPFATTVAANPGGNVLNVNDSFDTNNSSYHPVRGRQDNSYAMGSRMVAPWNTVTKTNGIVGQYGALMSCWDCHALPADSGTITQTVTAHGAAETLRGNPAGYGTGTGGAFSNATANGAGDVQVTLCQKCHTGYTESTASHHGTGSAISANTNNGMITYMRYGCNWCHGSARKPARPARAADVHGINSVPTSGDPAYFQALRSGGRWETEGGRPIAFIRNRETMNDHAPLKIGDKTYTPTCMGTVTGTLNPCQNQNNRSYTPAGVY
jgi:hypothetical protein